MARTETSGQRLRVVLIADWFFYYLAPIANALAEKCDVLVVSTDRGSEIGVSGDATRAKRALLDQRVRFSSIRRSAGSIFSVWSILRAAWAVRRFKPHVVHAQDHHDWRLLALASIARARASCLTVHDVEPHMEHVAAPQFAAPREPRRHLRARASLRLNTDGFIVHGQQLADTLTRQHWYRSGQRIFVVPHGVLAQPARRTPLPSAPTLLMFGRLEYYKGLDVLVRAAEMAAKEITGLKVIVAGAGPVAESCRALVTRPELFDWRVGFVPDNDIPDLFALCSVVVLPYRAASQSGVIPLAFANGRSVIATETGSLAEALHDGEDGLLVPPEDPESLARAIVRFHLEPGLAQRLTIQAVETVTSGRLSAAAVASRHLAAYQAMLEGPKGCST